MLIFLKDVGKEWECDIMNFTSRDVSWSNR